ncbi:hypothetical protein [Acinetobacter baumannii]|uniref:hypothetical protein n=1 Tax=Acinetobacter baumannii TaxID=470 RepID=UPI000DD08A34|nr:hypothetical protein [Acinetobacter baumannii]
MTTRSRIQIKGEDPKYPIAFDVELIAPVRIYTAVELAAMPLSQMIRCRDAQEEFYINNKKLSGRAKDIKERLIAGEKLTLVLEKKHSRVTQTYFIGEEIVGKKIVKQLETRRFIRLPRVEGIA